MTADEIRNLRIPEENTSAYPTVMGMLLQEIAAHLAEQTASLKELHVLHLAHEARDIRRHEEDLKQFVRNKDMYDRQKKFYGE